MGGFAALHFGLRYPQLVRSLTIGGVGYGAKPEQQAEYRNSTEREAAHAEAIGMAASPALAGSSYAQCLRAKDEAGWHRFAEQLGQRAVTGMAMTLRGVLAARPSLWHLADALRELGCPCFSLPATGMRRASSLTSFSGRRCRTRRFCYSAARRPPDEPRRAGALQRRGARISRRRRHGYSEPLEGRYGQSRRRRGPEHEQYGETGGEGRAGDGWKPRAPAAVLPKASPRRAPSRRELPQRREGRRMPSSTRSKGTAPTRSLSAPTLVKSTT